LSARLEIYTQFALPERATALAEEFTTGPVQESRLCQSLAIQLAEILQTLRCHSDDTCHASLGIAAVNQRCNCLPAFKAN
jgi:hypothetical protein